MRIDCKCYKCENRCIGCHSTCESYKEYKKAKDVIKHRIEFDKLINFRSFKRYVRK